MDYRRLVHAKRAREIAQEVDIARARISSILDLFSPEFRVQCSLILKLSRSCHAPHLLLTEALIAAVPGLSSTSICELCPLFRDDKNSARKLVPLSVV